MINLHNHTIYSDGQHTPREIVEDAIRDGVKVIAITDHIEWFFRGESYDNYFNEIATLRSECPQIKILIGFEIMLHRLDVSELPFELFNKTDLILFENIHGMEDYYKLFDLRNLIPCKVGLAHPVFNNIKDLKKLIDLLETNDVFVELNTSAFTWRTIGQKLLFETQEDFFKLLKGRNVKISIGQDTHSKREKYYLDRGYLFLKRMGLEKNLIFL
ncbi:PHP domain-containing protein [Nanoarchaeota archaeon]